MTREESIKIYNSYSRRLFNISLRIVGDSALAEEVMQDTILKYITGPGLFFLPFGIDREKKEGAWLSKTCVRASIDALRKIRRERLFLDEYATTEAPDQIEPAALDETGETPGLDKIKAAINELPGPYRLIVNLILIEGLDYEEISELTGESEGALRTRYSRARKMLAERLGNRKK
ncbi:MAG: RNA polymerase sigma factor [Bacteroidales bacterium]|nr:RNA polymerase sigma factor [Bacteroidales bacterium]